MLPTWRCIGTGLTGSARAGIGRCLRFRRHLGLLALGTSSLVFSCSALSRGRGLGFCRVRAGLRFGGLGLFLGVLALGWRCLFLWLLRPRGSRQRKRTAYQ